MNDFVNPQHRGVSLPSDFKDLMDVLAANKLHDLGMSSEGPIRAADVPRNSKEWTDGLAAIKANQKARNIIERFSTGGLAHATEYALRFLQSKSESVWLTFFEKSGGVAFTMHRRKDSCRIVFVLPWDEEVREKAVRGVLADSGIVPISNALTPDGAKRVVSYLMPNSPPDFLSPITRLLREVYGISDDGGLTLVFH